MKAEKLDTLPVICRGGLDSNQNWLYLNQTNIGVASELINFEPSLFGGYRRISGFTALPDSTDGEVDPTGAEGKTLGVFITSKSAQNATIMAARKQQSGSTYAFYKFVSGGAWSKITTGLTHNYTSGANTVDKVRYDTFNFDGIEKVIFVDGVNSATLYGGSTGDTWIDIGTGDTGANFENAGGAQALTNPSIVKVFKNHIFVGGSNTDGLHVIAHSAPSAEYNWTSASGAGQINAGFDVIQMYPFRDELYLFGLNKIKKIVVDSTGAFALQDVTDKIGCIAADSVVEINGDLIFLSPDGIRPLSATDRINDIEIASISKNIQQDLLDLISVYEASSINAVPVPSKSQFRLFFTPSSVIDENAQGIIGGIKNYEGNFVWEFGKLKGIKLSCVTQGRISGEEYVLHGTYDGKVMRQEQGTSFNGSNIAASYKTPYIDFQLPMARKTLQEIMLFLRAEGNVTVNFSIDYDWGIDYINPDAYESVTPGLGGVFGSGVFDIAVFGGPSTPAIITNIEGSGKSARFSFSTDGVGPSYSVQGFVIKYALGGYK